MSFLLKIILQYVCRFDNLRRHLWKINIVTQKGSIYCIYIKTKIQTQYKLDNGTWKMLMLCFNITFETHYEYNVIYKKD